MPWTRRTPGACSTLADTLVRQSVWIVGGDGWAYDIGFGGLDHVLASGAERQRAGAGHGGLLQHRRAAVQGHPARGGGQVRRRRQAAPKKDLGLLAMTYGNVYVARVAMGASDAQTLKAFLEAEASTGPLPDHRLQPLHRPRLRPALRAGPAEGGGRLRALAALPLPTPGGGRGASARWCWTRARPSSPSRSTPTTRRRYRMLAQAHPEVAERLLDQAQDDVRQRWRTYERSPRQADVARLPRRRGRPAARRPGRRGRSTR